MGTVDYFYSFEEKKAFLVTNYYMDSNSDVHSFIKNMENEATKLATKTGKKFEENLKSS